MTFSIRGHFSHIQHFWAILQDETVDKNSAHGKMRLTIPREPELETAHRAQRIRSSLVSIFIISSHIKCCVV